MTANTLIDRPNAASVDRSDRSVAERFERLYDRLVLAASHLLNRELRALGLDESALVSEAYLRLSRSRIGFSSEAGFRAAARRTLERTAIDFLRGSRRIKRGGRRRPLPLDAAGAIADVRDGLADVEWSDLLTRLHVANPRLAKIAKRLARGCRVVEIARDLGLAPSTVRLCRAQLHGWLRSRTAG